MAKRRKSAPIKYPEIAGVIRQAMATRSLTHRDLSRAMGYEQQQGSPTYNWANGVSAPSEAYRAVLAKVLHVSEADLTPRKSEVTMSTNGQVAVQVERVREFRPDPQLSFVILSDGNARLKLDVIGPIDRISAVLQHLLAERIVDPKQISHNEADNGQ